MDGTGERPMKKPDVLQVGAAFLFVVTLVILFIWDSIEMGAR